MLSRALDDDGIQGHALYDTLAPRSWSGLGNGCDGRVGRVFARGQLLVSHVDPDRVHAGLQRAADVAVVAVADHRALLGRAAQLGAGVREEQRVGLEHADLVGDEEGVEILAQTQEGDFLPVRLGEPVRHQAQASTGCAQAAQQIDRAGKRREVLLAICVVAIGAAFGQVRRLPDRRGRARRPHLHAQPTPACT